MAKTAIWFRNDLRSHDHQALHLGRQLENDLVAVYVHPSEATFRGIKRIGPFRKRFLRSCLDELKGHLQQIGIELFEFEETHTLIEWLTDNNIAHIITARQFTTEEICQTACVSKVYPITELDNESLFALSELPIQPEQLSTFTPFRHKVEKKGQLQDTVPTHTRVPVREMQVFEGGESFALARVRYYLWETDLIANYKETRNGSLGTNYSSHLSPWLSNGSLSPRTVWHEILRYEEEKGANESTYWLRFELLWREFFRWSALKMNNRLFRSSSNKIFSANVHKAETIAFQQWSEGRTGHPFVDAHMRHLNHTGFMSNRGRQVVASYWIHDMQGDWLTGAAWFEHQLIDYDAASNYGNWAYIAGVGADPRGGRKFNANQQMERYDPDGRFMHSVG